jgi:hypothetical protein
MVAGILDAIHIDQFLIGLLEEDFQLLASEIVIEDEDLIY